MILRAVLAVIGLAGVQAQVLYDPAIGTLPGAQDWAFLALPGPAVPVLVGGQAQLDTTANNGVRAGFSTIVPGVLDRVPGFSLRFTLQVAAEAHANANRAGVSLILLATDRHGIELGFWTNRIWAQAEAPLFTQAEGVEFDTQAAVTYELKFSGDTYTLSAGDGTVLTGAVRDYSAFEGLFDPYETPNFLFVGDDTTSARGSFGLGRVELVTAVDPPGLTMRRLSADSVELAWPVVTPAWTLESSTGLGAAWQPVSEPVRTENGMNRVELAADAAQRFFRLRP